MKWREIDPPSRSRKQLQKDKHRFKLVGELARKWDRMKSSHRFDDVVRIFQHKYRLNVSYDMAGMALHGILHNTPLEVVMDLSRELDGKNG